jgi:hypothetical protein
MPERADARANPEQWREAQGRVPMFSDLRTVSIFPEMNPITRARPAEGEAQMTGAIGDSFLTLDGPGALF